MKVLRQVNQAKSYLLCGLLIFCVKGYGETKGSVLHTPPKLILPLLQEARSLQSPLLDFRPFYFEKSSTKAKGQKSEVSPSTKLKFPVLAPYPALQEEVNKVIQAERKELLKGAKELFKKVPHSVFLPYRLYVEELRVFQPVDQDIVSVRFRLYSRTAGAHGGSQYHSWNYSQKHKKFLSLEDIFPISNSCAQLVMVGLKPLFQKKPLKVCASQTLSATTALRGSEDFLETIIRIRDLLFEHRKQGSEYDKHIKKDIIRGTAQKEHFKIWNLQEGNISFVFPEYQIGPYSAGSFEVIVPLPPRCEASPSCLRACFACGDSSAV